MKQIIEQNTASSQHSKAGSEVRFTLMSNGFRQIAILIYTVQSTRCKVAGRFPSYKKETWEFETSIVKILLVTLCRHSNHRYKQDAQLSQRDRAAGCVI